MTLDTVVEAANNFGDTREGAGAGPLALAVVGLLAIATILLWRNMTTRIKRLPSSFPTEKNVADAAEPTTAEPATGEPTAAPADAAAETGAKRSSPES